MAFNKINFAIAALFAVVIAGCSLGGSTEETSYLGGSSEEPSVQASLENVTVVGRAMRLALNPEDIDNGDWNSTAPYGSILRMAELDSVTLDTIISMLRARRVYGLLRKVATRLQKLLISPRGP